MLESAKTQHENALNGISRLQAQMTFRFSVLSKLLDRQMTGIAADLGLSLIAYRALATIDAFGEATAADLVRYTGYDKAALSRAIRGDAVLARAAPVVEARRKSLSSALSDEEEAVFLRSIEKLAAHVSQDLDQH